MQYLFYIILGLLPSFIWLSFYLRKDKHPEPNSLVIKIFFWGMLLAPMAIVLELAVIWLIDPNHQPFISLSQLSQANIVQIFLTTAFAPAVVEESLKYTVVKTRFLKKTEFDEPTDVMIYCIIAGLGFAAVENLLILSKFATDNSGLGSALATIGLRFVGATLLHALAAGITGYWLARALLQTKRKIPLIIAGLSSAIVFHATYNYLIIKMSIAPKPFLISLLAILLMGGGILVSYYFRRLKAQKSVCI